MLNVKYNKKGVTLLELVISLFFISIIFTIVLNAIFLGYKAKSDTQTASDKYLICRILENNMINDFQNASSIIIKKVNDVTVPAGYKKYSCAGDILTITSVDGTAKNFKNIYGFKIKVVNTGDRIILNYTISVGVIKDLYTHDGGLVLNNNSASVFAAENIGISYATEYNLNDHVNIDNNYIIYIK